MVVRPILAVAVALLFIPHLTAVGQWQPDETWTLRDEPWLDRHDVSHATVDAFLAYPADPTGVDTLVVMAHGYRHNATGSWWPHMQAVVSHGAAAVAMDFRDNSGFPVLRGAQDMNLATEGALARLAGAGFAIERVIAFGVSLGGAISGTAVAESDLYDIWFDVEGVTQLHETWAEARAALPAAADAIERDTGCPFHACPEEFARRSPAQRAADFTDLDAVYIIHALYDGLVPYDQGAQMAAALAHEGVNTRFVTVLRGEEGTDQDTTPGSHALGAENPVEQTHGLSGHGTESDATQAVMATSFELLWDLLAGAPTPEGFTNQVVDRR